MSFRTRLASTAALPLALLALSAIPASAATASHIAPAVQRLGQNLGQESPSTMLHLTAWLTLNNKAELDAKVAALYVQGSPTYHQWLTPAQLKAYGPSAAQVAAVKQELAAHNLTVTSVDPWNLSVRFSGRASDVESAFHTTINRMQVSRNLKSKTAPELIHTTSSQPALSGAAAGLVSHLGGFGSLSMQSHALRPVNPLTGKAFPGKVIPRNAKPDAAVFSSQCFYGPTTLNLSGVDGDTATIPTTATYTGLSYGANPANTADGTIAPCGYSATDLSTIYGLGKAYAQGVNGKGQTIVLVDPYLEPYIQGDMDTYSSLEGIPDTTINVLNPFGTTGSGIDQGWTEEADLDTQSAHAVAPGAAITLLEAATSDNEDLQYAILYAVENHLGNVISNSYGSPESFSSPLDNNIWSEVNEMGAASGISIQYSTGDTGDFTADGIPADVSTPADTPYGTAVGGTTVDLEPSGPLYTTGWGTNINFLSYFDGSTTYVYNPIEYSAYDFNFGSGGGISTYFAKPSYQSDLSGTGRHLPDVSAIADPYTGFEFVTSSDGVTEEVGAIGGTSLASPVFSAIWSLLDQAAGTSIGPAAPLMSYAAKTPFLDDVLPFAGPENVAGSSTAAGVTSTYTATDLAEPLATTTQFTSAIWNEGVEYLLVTFGTDSSLTLTQGWDNVTGYGTPNVGALADLITSIK
jgi:subtilase family serine protease